MNDDLSFRIHVLLGLPSDNRALIASMPYCAKHGHGCTRTNFSPGQPDVVLVQGPKQELSLMHVRCAEGHNIVRATATAVAEILGIDLQTLVAEERRQSERKRNKRKSLVATA